jgi:hypothetical protein
LILYLHLSRNSKLLWITLLAAEINQKLENKVNGVKKKHKIHLKKIIEFGNKKNMEKEIKMNFV